MNTPKVSDWEKELRLCLDDIFEDMESYDETESQSYADELFQRIFTFSQSFIFDKIHTAQIELLEKVRQEIVKISIPQGKQIEGWTTGERIAFSSALGNILGHLASLKQELEKK